MSTFESKGRSALESYINTQVESGLISEEDGKDLISQMDNIYATAKEYKKSTDAQYKKFEICKSDRIEPDILAQAYETLPKYDYDGNGSYKQAEGYGAIESISGGSDIPWLTASWGSTLTTSEKTVL